MLPFPGPMFVDARLGVLVPMPPGVQQGADWIWGDVSETGWKPQPLPLPAGSGAASLLFRTAETLITARLKPSIQPPLALTPWFTPLHTQGGGGLVCSSRAFPQPFCDTHSPHPQPLALTFFVGLRKALDIPLLLESRREAPPTPQALS